MITVHHIKLSFLLVILIGVISLMPNPKLDVSHQLRYSLTVERVNENMSLRIRSQPFVADDNGLCPQKGYVIMQEGKANLDWKMNKYCKHFLFFIEVDIGGMLNNLAAMQVLSTQLEVKALMAKNNLDYLKTIFPNVSANTYNTHSCNISNQKTEYFHLVESLDVSHLKTGNIVVQNDIHLGYLVKFRRRSFNNLLYFDQSLLDKGLAVLKVS